MARNRFIQTCIGAMVKELRLRAGFQERAPAARLLGTTPAKLARVEDGVNDSVEPSLVEMWAQKLGGSAEVQERLFEWACLTKDSLNKNTSLAGFKSGYIFLLYLERIAQRIYVYDPEYIPGLGQIEAYTRELITVKPDENPDAADLLVEGRRERQAEKQTGPQDPQNKARTDGRDGGDGCRVVS
jgi:transcriptional regulator with XRE-family HTH domain